MSDCRLTFALKDPTREILDHQELQNQLREIGLIGRSFDFYGEPSFEPGTDFWGYFEIEKIKVWKPGSLFRSGKWEEKNPDIRITVETDKDLGFDCSPEDMETVHCPQCHTVIEDWAQKVGNWYNDRSYLWECVNCKISIPPYKFNFDRFGAYSQQTINIWNIYKGSVPSTSFVEKLNQVTGMEFDYYYVRI